MAAVAHLFLLLCCGITGHAAPTSSLAPGWQDKPVVGIATCKGWFYDDCYETPFVMRGTDEPDEVLVKRTSKSHSHHRPSHRLQSTGMHSVPPNNHPPGAAPVPHILGGPVLSTATPSPVPAGGPSAPSEPGSKGGRRPYKSLKNNPALQAEAQRQYKNRMVEKIISGELIDKKKADGSEYTVKTHKELRAYRRLQNSHFLSKFTPEQKAERSRQSYQRSKQNKAKREAQQKAQEEGRPWQGSPVRKPGRPRKYEDQEPKQAGGQDARQQQPTHLGVEDATQQAMKSLHAPLGSQGPVRSRLRTSESSSGSWSMSESPPEASYHQFAPQPSSPQFDLDLSLSAPGSSSTERRQATHAPPAARTREEERLRPNLAPPSQHDQPGEHDRLQLSLAPPKSD